MRSRRRTGPLTHVLVAVDGAELDAARGLLALLPDDAYGLVLVETETETGAGAPDLPRPARVALTVLERDVAGPAGVRLSAAAAAWAYEWVVEEHDPTRDVSIWVGATVEWDSAPVQGQLERL